MTASSVNDVLLHLLPFLGPAIKCPGVPRGANAGAQVRLARPALIKKHQAHGVQDYRTEYSRADIVEHDAPPAR